MRRAGIILVILMVPALAGCFGGAPSDLEGSAGRAQGSAVFSDTHVFPGTYDTSGSYSRPLQPGPYGILEPEVVELESDVDGVTIQMGVVRPDVPDGIRVPVILDASPYYDPLTPERIKGNPHRDQIKWWDGNHYAYYAETFVPHGYAVVFLATRGTGDSGGCWTMFGPDERADVEQAITWLGSRDWSNGNVGTIGLSFEASSQWMAASTGNPHLKTIVPVVASAIDFYPGFVRNGTSSRPLIAPFFYTYGLGVEGMNVFGAVGAAEQGNAAALSSVLTDSVSDRRAGHRVEGALCPEAWTAVATSVTAEVPLGRSPSDFWAKRDFTDAVADGYRGSVLVANGLLDRGAMAASYPFVNTLEARGIIVKHLHGQWGHGFPDARIFGEDALNKRWDWNEILLHWFDRWLKGDEAIDIGPVAQIQGSDGRWRSEASWPPQDTTPLQFYAAADSTLTTSASSSDGTVLVAPCTDCPRFETGPLQDGLRFAGLPTFHATVTPLGPGGQLHAHLILTGPHGDTVLGDAVMDLRFADGTETPRPVVAGQGLVARMQFTPMDVAVPPGSGIALVVRPLEQGMPTPVQLHTGGDASGLTLHTFERGPDVFFEPPE